MGFIRLREVLFRDPVPQHKRLRHQGWHEPPTIIAYETNSGEVAAADQSSKIRVHSNVSQHQWAGHPRPLQTVPFSM